MSRRALSIAMQIAGVLMVIVGFAIAIAGCPKPTPTPVTPPDASDAAPPAASCDVACAHVAQLGCAGADACRRICGRVIFPAFRACVASATSCAAVSACDKE